MSGSVRIGIDVGGTFTKGVVLKSGSGVVSDSATLPTTHDAKEGVVRGVIRVLDGLLAKGGVEPEDVELIAYSTTQPVNALLEGDVAPVGVMALGDRRYRRDTKRSTALGAIELGDDHVVPCYHEYVDTTGGMDEEEVSDALDRLIEKGARAVVVTEAYGIEDPGNERRAVKIAGRKNILSVAGHWMSMAYGLEVRTITGCLNATLLEKMSQVADLMETSVLFRNIRAPIMVMKGNGGLMGSEEFRTRPMSAVLSGPSASMAGIVRNERVTDGIYLEFGGTSTNVGLIRNGEPVMNYVRVGEHPTCIRSFDIRVVGTAGGSMPRIGGEGIAAVGPRSAHIAGLEYSCFVSEERLRDPEIVLLAPTESDPEDYAAVRSGKTGEVFALTPTCAANVLGLTAPGDHAHGKPGTARWAFEALGRYVGKTAEGAALRLMERAVEPIEREIKALEKDFSTDKLGTDLGIVGAGGAASCFMPFIGQRTGLPTKIAENAEIISSVGVALSMVKTEEEISLRDGLSLRDIVEAAKKRAMAEGALPDMIKVETKYLADRDVVRVRAAGPARMDGRRPDVVTPDHARRIAAGSLGTDIGELERKEGTGRYHVFVKNESPSRFKGYIKGCIEGCIKGSFDNGYAPLAVVDEFGTIRLKARKGKVITGDPGAWVREREGKVFGEFGALRSVPQVHLIDDTRFLDLSHMTDRREIVSAIKSESGSDRGVTLIIQRG